jgi:hypothetical protein
MRFDVEVTGRGCTCTRTRRESPEPRSTEALTLVLAAGSDSGCDDVHHVARNHSARLTRDAWMKKCFTSVGGNGGTA